MFVSSDLIGSVAPADGSAFCISFCAHADDREMRELRFPAAFDNVAAAIPGVTRWIGQAERLGGVHMMGALQNRIRYMTNSETPIASGLVLIGDALSITNPFLGRGASIALDQARHLSEIHWSAAGLAECCGEYYRRVTPLAVSSFRDAAEADRLQRLSHAGDVDAFNSPRAVIGRAAIQGAATNADFQRAWLRHWGLLAPPHEVVTDRWLLAARAILEGKKPRSQEVPKRPDLLRLMRHQLP
jgi:hypothetical protein